MRINVLDVFIIPLLGGSVSKVEGNRRVPDFWFFAVMIAREFKWGSLVLNCENAGDSRQSKHEPLVTGTRLNPVFTPVWGPVEGRVVNLALKVAL